MNQQGIAFTQIVGENITYEQDVVNDTIASAEWTVTPSGPVLTNPTTIPAKTLVTMESDQPGVFVLSVEMVFASGQIRIGQARITVIQVNV